MAGFKFESTNERTGHVLNALLQSSFVTDVLTGEVDLGLSSEDLAALFNLRSIMSRAYRSK